MTTGDILNRSTQMTQGDIIRAQIAALYFMDYGTVASVVDDTHVSVKLWYQTGAGEDIILDSVELILLGSSSVHIAITPKEGDLVALFGSRRPIEQLAPADKQEGASASLIAYTLATVKALQLFTPSTSDAVVDIAVGTACDVAIKADVTVNVTGAVALKASGSVTVNDHLEIKP